MFDALPGLQEFGVLLAVGVVLFTVANVLYHFVEGLAAGAKQ